MSLTTNISIAINECSFERFNSYPVHHNKCSLNVNYHGGTDRAISIFLRVFNMKHTNIYGYAGNYEHTNIYGYAGNYEHTNFMNMLQRSTYIK